MDAHRPLEVGNECKCNEASRQVAAQSAVVVTVGCRGCTPETGTCHHRPVWRCIGCGPGSDPHNNSFPSVDVESRAATARAALCSGFLPCWRTKTGGGSLRRVDLNSRFQSAVEQVYGLRCGTGWALGSGQRCPPSRGEIVEPVHVRVTVRPCRKSGLRRELPGPCALRIFWA